MLKYKLKDIFELYTGCTPLRNNSEYWSSRDNKWIKISDLPQSGKYISDTREHVSDKAVKENNLKLIPANTVVMTYCLSIGKTAITDKEMYLSCGVMAFCDKNKIPIIPEYIYWALRVQKWDKYCHPKLGGKALTKTDLSEFEIEICTLEKQKQIAGILDNILKIIQLRIAKLKKLNQLIKILLIDSFSETQY